MNLKFYSLDKLFAFFLPKTKRDANFGTQTVTYGVGLIEELPLICKLSSTDGFVNIKMTVLFIRSTRAC